MEIGTDYFEFTPLNIHLKKVERRKWPALKRDEKDRYGSESFRERTDRNADRRTNERIRIMFILLDKKIPKDDPVPQRSFPVSDTRTPL